MRRILILDFDGVLNGERWADRPEHPSLEDIFQRRNDGTLTASFLARLLDPACTGRLIRLLEDVPSLEIVLSTSWRTAVSLPLIKGVLAAHGIPDRIVDQTPFKLSGLAREDEILRWVQTNDPMLSHRYVIFDDLPLDFKRWAEYADHESPIFKALQDSFIKTDPECGLTEADLESAKLLLSTTQK